MFGLFKKKEPVKEEEKKNPNVVMLTCFECNTEHPINLKKHKNKDGDNIWYCPSCGSPNTIKK